MGEFFLFWKDPSCKVKKRNMFSFLIVSQSRQSSIPENLVIQTRWSYESVNPNVLSSQYPIRSDCIKNSSWCFESHCVILTRISLWDEAKSVRVSSEYSGDEKRRKLWGEWEGGVWRLNIHERELRFTNCQYLNNRPVVHPHWITERIIHLIASGKWFCEYDSANCD